VELKNIPLRSLYKCAFTIIFKAQVILLCDKKWYNFLNQKQNIMSLKKIIIIRHAESQEDVDPNLKGILKDSEISITENGISEINEVASEITKIISSFKTTTIYSSISNRASETSTILKK